MNLRDFDAIDRLGASIYERWGKLDALLGNAGMLGAADAADPSGAQDLCRSAST